MKAVVRERFGSEEVLELGDVAEPELQVDQVLVRVRAASLNPVDWYAMRGRPTFARVAMGMGLRAPKEVRIGTDYAGTVEAAGANVTGLRAGDDVWGMRTGALAERISQSAEKVTLKPANVSFEEAAAVPVAGLTALQGLRDVGGLEAGDHVLINGASGGVGHFAVQIAKTLGAQVTAVCSTSKVELVRELGADTVIDYTREDFTTGEPATYDVMFDVAGSRRFSEYRRVLKPDARIVVVGAKMGASFLGPLKHVLGTKLAAIGKSQSAAFFVAKNTKGDMLLLKEWIESGAVKPVVERAYPLSAVRDAFRHLGEGHARAKIVVTI